MQAQLREACDEFEQVMLTSLRAALSFQPWD